MTRRLSVPPDVLNELPNYGTPEWARIVMEAQAQAGLLNAAALAQVRRNQAAKVRPAIVYRCAKRCELFTVWKQPEAVIVSHRARRLSARRLNEQTSANNMLHVPNARLPELAGGEMIGALVVPPHAYVWTPGREINVACQHVYGCLGEKFAPVLEAEIAASLKLKSTHQIIVDVSLPDRNTRSG